MAEGRREWTIGICPTSGDPHTCTCDQGNRWNEERGWFDPFVCPEIEVLVREVGVSLEEESSIVLDEHIQAKRCECLYDDKGRRGWAAGDPCPVHPEDWNRGWFKDEGGEWHDYVYLPEESRADTRRPPLPGRGRDWLTGDLLSTRGPKPPCGAEADRQGDEPRAGEGNHGEGVARMVSSRGPGQAPSPAGGLSVEEIEALLREPSGTLSQSAWGHLKSARAKLRAYLGDQT